MYINHGTCKHLRPLFYFDKEFPCFIKHSYKGDMIDVLVSMGGEWIIIKEGRDLFSVRKYELSEYNNCNLNMQEFIEDKIDNPTTLRCGQGNYKKFLKYKHHYDMSVKMSYSKFEEL